MKESDPCLLGHNWTPTKGVLIFWRRYRICHVCKRKERTSLPVRCWLRLRRHLWALRNDGRCDEWCCTNCLRWRPWNKPVPKRRHPNWENYMPCCWNPSCRNVAEANLDRIAAMGND